MHAVILERNKLVGRKVARWFVACGATATVVEDPAALLANLGAAHVLCADTFDGDLVAEQVRARPGIVGILWTAEPLRRSLKYMAESPALNHVIARRDFESAPRSGDVLMLARRLATRVTPPFAAHFDWGATIVGLTVRTSADRDIAVAHIQDFVGALNMPKRVMEMFGELGHELLMNAMYDAPVDAQGLPKYAGDRRAHITLTEAERPIVELGTDGSRLGIRVRDPFGRLERRHVVDGLSRGLAGGEMDRSHGGAGLGMMVCHNSSSVMIFDVAPGRYTEVTALFELDHNLREFRTLSKSLHFWSH